MEHSTQSFCCILYGPLCATPYHDMSYPTMVNYYMMHHFYFPWKCAGRRSISGNRIQNRNKKAVCLQMKFSVAFYLERTVHIVYIECVVSMESNVQSMDMSMVAICAIKSKQCHIWVSEMSGKLMLWKRSFNCFLWNLSHGIFCSFYCLPCPRVVNELFGFMEHLVFFTLLYRI